MYVRKSFLLNGLTAMTEIVGSCFLEDSVSIKSDFHKVNVATRMAKKQDLGYLAIIWVEKLMEIISFSRL